MIMRQRTAQREAESIAERLKDEPLTATDCEALIFDVQGMLIYLRGRLKAEQAVTCEHGYANGDTACKACYCD